MDKRETLVELRGLSSTYPLGNGRRLRALDGVSFTVRRREVFALVGESGSGKSTLARALMGLQPLESGQIFYRGIDLGDRQQRRQNRALLERSRQFIFQDSFSSLNPRMRVGEIITEPLEIHHMAPPRGSLRAEALFQMKYVGLDAALVDRTPAELSGGQRQRVAIARALVMEPELLVADEPVAALDVSIQAQIINLFRHLQAEHGFTFLFIAHDLSLVSYLADRVGVLYRGKLVELAPAEALFSHPRHPYTKALLSAVPLPDPRRERARTGLHFDETAWNTGGVFTEVAPEHFVLLEKGGQTL